MAAGWSGAAVSGSAGAAGRLETRRIELARAAQPDGQLSVFIQSLNNLFCTTTFVPGTRNVKRQAGALYALWSLRNALDESPRFGIRGTRSDKTAQTTQAIEKQIGFSYRQRGFRLGSNARRCGEMADAQDLKSWALKKACGFESHHRHHDNFAL